MMWDSPTRVLPERRIAVPIAGRPLSLNKAGRGAG